MMDDKEKLQRLEEIKCEIGRVNNGIKAYEKSIKKDLLYIQNLLDELKKDIEN